MKNKHLGKKVFLFLSGEVLIIILSLYCWGFWGKVEEKRFKFMLQASTPAQKETLCKALNFYYDRGLAKYTSGLLLRCEPETESMLNQFAWFHRNTLSYYIKDEVSYHEVLISTLDYFDLLEDINPQEVSTYYLERKLTNWQRQQQEAALTDKDKNSLLLTLLDVGGTLLLSSSSPVGTSISALSLLHKAASDPAKSVPAIVVFKKQRENSFLWTVLILSILNLAFSAIILRKK